MKKEINVSREELQVVNGKLVINSEELAEAIQNQEIDLQGEEEAEAITINMICPKG